MKTSLTEVRNLAKEFLVKADELNEKVENYFWGSNKKADIAAYETIKKLYIKFIDAVNDFYGCKEYGYEIDYNVAESFFTF